MNKNQRNLRSLLALVAIALLLAACASMGSPQGGPRDTRPPQYVKANPEPGAVNHLKSKVEIVFDENVKIDDANNRVVVSPAQRTPPAVTALGKKVILELRDTLIPNTTYTIDFSDAIRDLNEGNILDGFATDFSTGPTRDSLQISGMVMEARNLEPAQAMLVGAYRINERGDSTAIDSLLATAPFDRIAKTNQLGQFTLRNLKEGTYRVYAVKDNNRDYHWDRSEDVAFYDIDITPGHCPSTVTDTLTATNGTDSLVTRAVTAFIPNDVLLTWFNENYRAQYLRNHKRVNQRKISIDFAAPSDTLPRLVIANGPNAGREASQWAQLQASATLDTLTYWITDPRVLAQDSLFVAATYLRTDTLDNLTPTTDTLKLFYRPPKEKKKKNNENDSIPQLNFINITQSGTSTLDLNKPLVLSWTEPVDSINRQGFSLAIKRDTVWTPVALKWPQSPHPLIGDMKRAILSDTIKYAWEPGASYQLTIDSAAIWSVYGDHNKPTKFDFTVKREEDYANVIFKVSGTGDLPVVVELLTSGDAPWAQAPVVGGEAKFSFVTPSAYYARAYVDANSNGRWDTGNVMSHLQPEEVYYYPKRLNIRANWDVEQSWNLQEFPLDTQKPLDIKKNKPVTKEKSQQSTDEDDDDFDNLYQGPGSQYDNNHRDGGARRPGGVRTNSNDQRIAK